MTAWAEGRCECCGGGAWVIVSGGAKGAQGIGTTTRVRCTACRFRCPPAGEFCIVLPKEEREG